MKKSPDMMNIQIVGLPWYDPGTYGAVRALMSDADMLPGTYAVWLGKAKRTEDIARQRGIRTVRVVLDLVQFPAWCAANRPGLHVDAKARTSYTSAIVAHQHFASQAKARH